MEDWKITIKFNNAHHICQGVLEFEKDQIDGSKGVRKYVDTMMIPKLKELKWCGFGLWCQHEPITVDTIFDDLNYMRKANGSIVFDCEDHNCQYRVITVPIRQEKECVVCMEPNDMKHFLPCMHMCVCSKCWPNIDQCPLCRKRKRKK